MLFAVFRRCDDDGINRAPRSYLLLYSAQNASRLLFFEKQAQSSRRIRRLWHLPKLKNVQRSRKTEEKFSPLLARSTDPVEELGCDELAHPLLGYFF